MDGSSDTEGLFSSSDQYECGNEHALSVSTAQHQKGLKRSNLPKQSRLRYRPHCGTKRINQTAKTDCLVKITET